MGKKKQMLYLYTGPLNDDGTSDSIQYELSDNIRAVSIDQKRLGKGSRIKYMA